MLQKQNISTISELRFKTDEVFKKIKSSPVYILHRSTPKGVLMSLEKYQEMIDTLEDYYLSLRAQDYEKENKSTIPWVKQTDVKKMLG